MESKTYNTWKNIITLSIFPVIMLSSYFEKTNNPGKDPLKWESSGFIGGIVSIFVIAFFGTLVEYFRKNKKDVTGLMFFVLPWLVLTVFSVITIFQNI